MTVKNKIIEWFETQSGQKNIDTKSNYFEQGLIDSFDVIMLMDFCESEMSVTFSEVQFEDRRFSTIDGLVDIIQELKGE
ncbi:acyl carrier protein [Enterovibrio paralichthyis]|uniref:acyl carrier protein n=1 Tax=Enterovibrio paralichthyis TaxID=2853805 RepID=UPI001C468983|nr:acyl carrier protein [Enterovibrio paralichthyis]MBV7298630.1 acyl carrier protein [Enterovibrio paralichthyis]